MKDGNKQALVRALMEGVDRAPKKDKPGLLDDAARLAEAGRYGDKIVAHINPEEAALLKARGGSGTINPRTGLMEFADMDGQGTTESGAVGAGVSDNPGYGTVDTFGGASPGVGAMPGEDRNQAPNLGDFAPALADGGRDEGDRGRAAGRAGGIGGFNDSRGFFDRVGDFLSTRVNDMRANPFATAINTFASFTPLGIPNTVSGWVGGPTIGGTVTAAARGLSGYESTPGGLLDSATNPGGSKDSPLGNDTRGGNGGASGDGGALSRPNTALASALMGQPQAGSPANPFGGRKTFGALADSFDPNGRRYVTPWAYRG